MEDSVYEKHGWSGTATELLTALGTIANKININTAVKQWPRGANALTRRLNEIRSNLRESNIAIEYNREGHSGVRTINIRIISSASADRQQDGNHSQNVGDNADGVAAYIDGSQVSSAIPSSKIGRNHAQNGLADDADSSDDPIQASAPSETLTSWSSHGRLEFEGL